MMVVERNSVLVVDDDASMRRTLQDVLELGGYSAASAGDGHSALALARAAPPAVAIVDLRLPDMDGLDLAGRLQAVDDRTQVVILTGNATVESAVRALRDEGCDYLVKPIRPDDLLRTVTNAEGRWRLREVESDLREKTVLLQALFDASPLPFVVVDAELRVRLWNASAVRVFGWPREEVVGRPLSVLHRDPEMDAWTFLPHVLHGKQYTGEEVRARRRDGGSLCMRMSGAPLRDAQGAVSGALAVYEDITEQRVAEAHLHHVQRLDALGRLAGGVAHDFNNLIGVIRSEMDLALEEEGLADELRESLTAVQETADRAAGLTRHLLTFARRQPMQSAVVEINTVVADLERMLRRLIGDNIRIVMHLDAAAGSVNVDRGQLEQVLTNLVVNARDAIDGVGRITVTTRNERGSPEGAHADPDDGDWVVVSVTDSGSGIPERLRSRIFEPFFSTKAPGEGTGLGLSTSHGIVQGMGGLIAVESARGVGSTFKVWLPRSAAAFDTVDAAVRGPARAPVGHEVILLVEDHTALLDVARRILIRQGYTVYAAVDEEEAWTLLEDVDRPPDLLLTDLHLPTGDGRDLIRRMQERFPALKCLLTSGTAREPIASEPGMPFLPKPYTLPTLARAVRDVLDGRDVDAWMEGESGV